MKDRIQEINLEISKLLKKKSNPKKLESLQAELKELLINRRLPPTIYKAVTKKERKPRKTKSESNLIDFQKEKSVRDFINEIKTGKLYKDLRKKKRIDYK